jgi:hypothetical protein
MLTGAVRAALILVVAAVAASSATPASAQLNPDDPCEADPTSAQCQDLGQPPHDPPTSSPEGERSCGTHNGVPVPCEDESLGFWVGTPRIVYGYYTNAEGTGLVGCWARPMSEPAPRPQPDWQWPIQGEDPGGTGQWYRLSCLGADGVWPDGVVVDVAAAWLPTGGASGPDPQEIARRALAQIGLAAPEIIVAPPANGSVPLGMPIWLATAETAQTWGPISDEFCAQGLCVEVSAEVVSIAWEMGDGATVTCTRGQNVVWRPGRDFLAPSGCHHFYELPSRSEPEGRYPVTATTTWRAQWAGGGQSGVFDGVVEACGPTGDALCQSTVQIAVEEIQVLGTR